MKLFKGIFCILLSCFACLNIALADELLKQNDASQATDTKAVGAKNDIKYDISRGYGDLADAIIPSVVSITATKIVKPSQQDIARIEQFEELFNFFGMSNRNLFENKESKTIVVGSGFFVSKEGYIVTNNHVVENATSIEVKNYKGKTKTATILASDSQTDISILKIDADNYEFSIASFGDSNKSRIGDFAFVIGNPFGLGNSLTSGIISARGRTISDSPYSDYIQTDAAINKGNSGGPLFNINGEVIGINTAIYTPSGGSVGIGFAIPSNISQNIVERLIKDKKIVRAWLGVGISAVDKKIAESTMYNSLGGAFVSKVYDKSPAQKAGVKEMDIITHINDNKIEEFANLPLIISNQQIDKKIELKVWRFGKEITLNPMLEKLKESDNKTESNAKIKTFSTKTATVVGITVSEKSIKKSQQNGVIIESIDSQSPVINSGLKNDMIITAINNVKIINVDDFVKAIKQAIKESKKTVLFKVKNGDQESIIAVSIA